MHTIIKYEFKQIYDDKSIVLDIKNNTLFSNLKQLINYDIKRIYNLELNEYDIIDANAQIDNQYNEIEHNTPINLDSNLLITNIYHNNSIFYIKPKNMNQHYKICNICYYFRSLHNFNVLSCCSQSICNICVSCLESQQCPLCRSSINL